MNICELIENNSSNQEPPGTDQPVKEDDSDNNASDRQGGAQALTISTSESGPESETIRNESNAENVSSNSASASADSSETKNDDDDDDNSVYNSEFFPQILYLFKANQY